MSDFSIAAAAVAGPRAIARRPVALIIWYVIMVLISAFTFAAITDLLGPALADMQAIRAAGPQTDPTMALQAMSKVMRGYVVLAPLSLVIGAVTTGAANRMVLRPEDGGLGYFKLGADELRLLVVLLVIGLIFIAVSFIGLLVAGAIGAVVAGAAGGAPDAAKMQSAVLLGFIPALLLLIFLGVRLSLAPAQTVATRTINIFGSWGLTRGRFWRIFLTYLVSVIAYAVVVVVMMLVIGQVGRGLGAAINGPVMQPDLTSTANLTTPPMIAYILLNAITQVASLLLLACPGAAIYQQIVNQPDEAEAF